MVPELVKPIEMTVQYRKHIQETVRYLKQYVRPNHTVLDIGENSPLTDALREETGAEIYNTYGDLDTGFRIPNHYYTAIIYSHTIEHQFNPLYTLLRIKEIMNSDTKLFIMLPSRGKLLWTDCHYHEIDHYRMQLLLKRAGLKIMRYERRKHWREWSFYLKGLRPLMRLIFEYNAYYIVTK